MTLICLFPQMWIVQFFKSLDWPSWPCISKYCFKILLHGLVFHGSFLHRSSMWALTGLCWVLLYGCPCPRPMGSQVPASFYISFLALVSSPLGRWTQTAQGVCSYTDDILYTRPEADSALCHHSGLWDRDFWAPFTGGALVKLPALGRESMCSFQPQMNLWPQLIVPVHLFMLLSLRWLCSSSPSKDMFFTFCSLPLLHILSSFWPLRFLLSCYLFGVGNSISTSSSSLTSEWAMRCSFPVPLLYWMLHDNGNCNCIFRAYHSTGHIAGAQ